MRAQQKRRHSGRLRRQSRRRTQLRRVVARLSPPAYRDTMPEMLSAGEFIVPSSFVDDCLSRFQNNVVALGGRGQQR